MARMQVWADANFTGDSVIFTGNAPTIPAFMNDRISSFKVENGEWVLWSNANFTGVGIIVGPGDYPTITPRLNDVVSSIQVRIE